MSQTSVIVSDNLRGVALMVLGMAGLAITDVLLKVLGGAIPLGQLMMVQGLGATLIFGTLARRQGVTRWRKNFLLPVVIWRNLFEILAAVSFLSALVLVPLSTLSAILQANPLIVTLGAAIWFKEPVGPRRWAAIAVGFVGVLLVIRPWSDSFSTASLLAITAATALAVRDLLTRRLPAHVATHQAATYAVFVMGVVGIVLLFIQGTPLIMPTPTQALLLMITLITLPIGYFGITAAMRVGEIAVVTPFRYSRIVFALILAALIFGERPDALTYLGAAIIVASGLYTIWREQVRRRA
ncbi:MAG: DMT family transporter [Paracoccaceae bacterium]